MINQAIKEHKAWAGFHFVFFFFFYMQTGIGNNFNFDFLMRNTKRKTCKICKVIAKTER